MAPRIWLFSAYRSDSHAYWVDGLLRHHPEIDWRVFELPGRHFAWRIRSNPLSWLDEVSAALRQQGPNLILASSMVDLATLKGLHPELAGVPSLYYFHENQLAYPIIPGQVQSIEPAMIQIYGALAADHLLFNSSYNQTSFLAGIENLARRLPDGIPGRLAARLEEKCRVLPVAVEPLKAESDRNPNLILWNHRWEHDKQPDLFADAMIELARTDRRVQLALLGPRSTQPHAALNRLLDTLGDRIAVNGFLGRSEYESWLGRAGIVVSTAIHEFQGISLLEAVSAGAWPVVPDALCYPEQYPDACRYKAQSGPDLIAALRLALDQPDRAPPDVSTWLAPATQTRWAELLSLTSSPE